MVEKFKNHRDRAHIIMFSTISFLGFIIGFIWIYAEDGFDWFAIIFGCIIFLFILFSTVILSEYIERPKEIEVTEDGITLIYQSWRRKRNVTWVQIDKINHRLFEQYKNDCSKVDSGLFIKGMKGYALVNWNIAEVLREKYKVHIGNYPRNEVIEMERTNR